jgi:hypothetical protein
MLSTQALLTVGIILGLDAAHWPEDDDLRQAFQSAGAAVALCLALGMASVLKARLLSKLLGAPVQGWRWPLVWAAAAAILVGYGFTSLPQAFEWAELVIGSPLILLVFGWVVWLRGFTQEDRELFRLRKDREPTLPPPDAASP